MAPRDQDFAALMQQVRDGSNDALEQVIVTYGSHVCRVVRRKLAPEMRSLFDSADLVQSIWAATIADRVRLANCQSAYELINFLAKVASDRMIDERRKRLKLARRNLARETPLAALRGTKSLSDSGPTPSQVAIAKECQEHLTHNQRTQIRQMIVMKLDGATHDEIGAAFGVTAKTVQRLLRRLERQVRP